MERLASLFISHGAPTLPLKESPAREFLVQLGREMPRPAAIAVLSPHWLTRKRALKSPGRFETWHDFGGFPQELYQIQYRPPGVPDLLPPVLDAVFDAGLEARASDDVRLDHGVWVPLMLMYPQADVPVVQVSATWDTPRDYFALGKAVRGAVPDDVLVVGSGGLVHNLTEIEMDGEAVPEWSAHFDDWTDTRLRQGDWEELFEYRRHAPGAARAHPTEDHFLPLFFAGGAGGAGGKAKALHRSFQHGSLGMSCYGFD